MTRRRARVFELLESSLLFRGINSMLSKSTTIMLGQGSGVVDPGYEARSPTACDVGKRPNCDFIALNPSHSPGLSWAFVRSSKHTHITSRAMRDNEACHLQLCMQQR